MEICELGNSWVKKENENKRKEKKRLKDVILKFQRVFQKRFLRTFFDLKGIESGNL